MRGEARTAEQGRARTALLARAAAITAWLATGLAALLGDLIHPSLRPDDDAAQTAVIVAMWLAYAVVLAALLLPGPRALTVARIGVPAGGLEAALAAANSSDLVAVIALFVGLLGTLVVLQPLYAEAHVNAASYGDERRFLLRPPGPVMIALIVPVWAVAVIGVAAGPLLLADRGWTAGIVAAAVGLPVAAFAAHALFRLNRRWLVFVPNGLVVHDHLAVSEPLPLSRRSVDSIGPARTGTGRRRPDRPGLRHGPGAPPDRARQGRRDDGPQSQRGAHAVSAADVSEPSRRGAGHRRAPRPQDRLTRRDDVV